MARIPLSSGFQLCPAGEHVFRINEVTYDEAFGTLTIAMKTEKGIPFTKKFNLMAADGTMNDAAINSFSYLARNALNDFNVEDIDPQELTGRFIRCEVTHTEKPSTKDPSRTVTFANLDKIYPDDGWEVPAAPVNLDDILG